MRKLAATILVLMLTTLCITPAAAGTGRPQVLRLGWSGKAPTNLDSAMASDDPALFILNQTMEGLVRQDAEGAIRKGSGAAADWTVSADGLTYTFTLKAGLTWSDGKPLTSRDYAYAWLRSLDPQKPGEYSYQLYYIKGAIDWASMEPQAPGFKVLYGDYKNNVGIRTPDDRTLVVELEVYTPYFLRLLTWPVYLPQRADLVERYGDNYGTDLGKMAFSGPFTVTAWEPGKRLRMERNVHYWNQTAVPLDAIDAQFSEDEAGLVQQREQGLLDMVKLSSSTAGQYRTRPGYRTDERDTTQYLVFNMDGKRAPYLSNVHIRKALHLAIDRQALAESGYPGSARPATGFVPDGIHLGGIEFRAAAGELIPVRADVKAAQAELAIGLKELGLQALPPLELLATTTAVYDKPMAAIKRMWEESLPGVSVQVTRVSFKTVTERVDAGDYQIANVGWMADYDDPATFMDLFVTGNRWRRTLWRSSTYDGLVRAASRTGMDPLHRLVNYADAERLLMDSVPVSPLLFAVNASIRAPQVQGVIVIPTVPYLDLRQAWIVP